MVTIQINISMDELLSSSTSTPRKNKKGGAPIRPVVTGGGLGNRSKHGGPANHGQGVVKGALVRISASCWRGGANLARRGRGAMEERGGVLSFNFKMFKLGGRSSQDQSLLLFPNLKFSLYVILRVLSVLEKGSHDLKVLAMLD